MKKRILLFLLLVISVFITPFSYKKVSAEESIDINTIYPNSIIDYTDLTNISLFSIKPIENEDTINHTIAYTLDKSTLIVFFEETKEYIEISGFNNIKKIKIAGKNILIADNNYIRIVDLETKETNIQNLDRIIEISLTNTTIVDIYVTDTNILIGTILEKTFNLYEYTIDLLKTKTNPIKTTTNTNFEKTKLLAINKNNAYIVFEKNSDTGITGLCIQNYVQSQIIIKDFKHYANVLDTFYYNDSEYLITFTNEILYLLNPDGSEVCNIKIETKESTDSQHFPILKVSDIDFVNNKIYISDSIYKTIQSFNIIEDESNINIISREIILCSNGFSTGRFDNVSDIFIQGDRIFTADTNNNRIHYLEDKNSIFIDDLENNSNPTLIEIDNQNTLYLIKNTDTQSILCSYTYQNNKYKKNTEYSKINNINIGFISDMCVNNDNTLYLLDYTYNRLLYLSNNSLQAISFSKQPAIILNNYSKLEYVKGLDKLALLNNNNIFLLNNKGEIDKQANVTNCTDITVDYDKIYAICNNEIKMLTTTTSELIVDERTLTFDNLANITNLTFDISKRQMIGFDNKRSCLVYFNCNLSPMPFSYQDITNISKTINLKALNIKDNSLIFDYPYEIGNYYNFDNSIKTAICIDEFDEYYQILFSNNNQLNVGFIKKANCKIVDYTYKPINVVTTYQSVPVYKYPTRLTYNGQRIIINYLNKNTTITLQYLFPITIDNQSFYMYSYNNTIGFVDSAEVVIDSNSSIKNLNIDNASIKLIGEESLYLLDEDKKTPIYEISNNSRIYVENYDKNEEYTRIIYKDADLNTHEGYIKTSCINMDKLNNSQIVLIIIIIISIIFLVLIAVSYIIIRKKNK